MEIPKGEGYETIVEGNLLKKVLKEGEGQTPKKGQLVSALYRGTLMNGDEFDSNTDRDSPFEFTIGTGQVIKGWDQGFATMKRGEKAELICGPDFAYGSRGSGAKIPPNSTLKFEVELLDFKDKQKEKWELSEEQKLSSALKLKDAGNDLFRSAKNKEAAKEYQSAISYLQDVQSEEAIKLLNICRLNLAQAFLKTKEWSKAVDNTTKVLQKDPNNSKGLFRRGVAYLELQDFTKAAADLELLVKNEPENNDAKKQLNRLRSAKQAAKKKEKMVFGKIFSQSYYDDVKPTEKKQEDYKKVDSSSDEEEKPTEATKTEEDKKAEPVPNQ